MINETTSSVEHASAIPSHVAFYSNCTGYYKYLEWCQSVELALCPAGMQKIRHKFLFMLLADPGDPLMDCLARSIAMGHAAEREKRHGVSVEGNWNYLGQDYGLAGFCPEFANNAAALENLQPK